MYDIIIIGSGPAGLSAAVYAKRANLDIAVVEKEYEGSGQIAESGNVNNYLGLPNINGYELGEKFRNHALSLEVPFIEKEALRISKTETAGQWPHHSLGRLRRERTKHCNHSTGNSHSRVSFLCTHSRKEQNDVQQPRCLHGRQGCR